MGTPRYGTTTYITYRTRFSDPETATRDYPTKPGEYTARFVVEESANYAGTSRDVDFTVYANGSESAKTETETTEVPVPYTWLDPYLDAFAGGATGEAGYEAAGNATGRNGLPLWGSYLAGLDPTDPTSQFKALITIDPSNEPVVTWTPDLSAAEKPRVYTTYGKVKLTAAEWLPVTDANKSQIHFFKIKVEIGEKNGD